MSEYRATDGIEEGMYTFRAKVTEPDGTVEVSYSEDNYCKDREHMQQKRDEYKQRLTSWNGVGTVIHVSEGVRQDCDIPAWYLLEEEDDNNLIEYDDDLN